MYEVKLSSGRTIRNLRQNGTMFETSEDLREEDFAGGLREVEIKHVTLEEREQYMPELEGKYTGMTLDYLKRHGETTQFALGVPSEEERKMKALEGNVAYIAMMGGIEIDE